MGQESLTIPSWLICTPHTPIIWATREAIMAQLVKNLPAMRETWVWSLVWEDSLEKGKATQSSILAWRIPWTIYSPWGGKESDMAERLSLSLWASQVALMVKNPPASAGDIRDAGSIPGSGRLPGEGNGNSLQYSCLENPMRSLAGYSPCSHKESDTTKAT